MDKPSCNVFCANITWYYSRTYRVLLLCNKHIPSNNSQIFECGFYWGILPYLNSSNSKINLSDNGR